MTRWATGADQVQALIEAGDLEMVTPSQENAQRLLAEARQHLRSASVLAHDDPPGAYDLLYAAARKALSAVLGSRTAGDEPRRACRGTGSDHCPVGTIRSCCQAVRAAAAHTQRSRLPETGHPRHRPRGHHRGSVQSAGHRGCHGETPATPRPLVSRVRGQPPGGWSSLPCRRASAIVADPTTRVPS